MLLELGAIRPANTVGLVGSVLLFRKFPVLNEFLEYMLSQMETLSRVRQLIRKGKLIAYDLSDRRLLDGPSASGKDKP